MRRIISLFIVLAFLCLNTFSCAPQEPYIGSNGNWWIGDKDLGISSKDDEGLKDARDIKLAFWNIGHFSNGGKNSNIKSDVYTEMLGRYRDFIYNEINADVMCLAEYSALFGMLDSQMTRSSDVLFDKYDFKYESIQRNYFCNAIFSNVSVIGNRAKEYDCNQNATITHTDLITAQDYYYIDTDIYINGEILKLVTVHLAFDKNKTPDVINQNQILELIEKYKYYDNVVMIGDFNCQRFDYFNIFRENGYQLGNNSPDSITFPSSGKSLDNVIYKGVKITDFQIHETDLSDHYAISCVVKANLNDYDESALSYTIHPSSLESCGYTIVTYPGENFGKWLRSSSYFGSVIELQHIPFDFEYVTMENLTPQTGISVAFITALPIDGEYPKYCANTEYYYSRETTVTIEVPKDAKYMFIYHTSKKGSKDETIYLPDSIVFTKI